MRGSNPAIVVRITSLKCEDSVVKYGYKFVSVVFADVVITKKYELNLSGINRISKVSSDRLLKFAG